MHYLNLGDFSGRKLLRMGLTLVILVTGLDGLSDVRLEGPRYVHQGEHVKLQCNYKLGNDSLYAVKWYRGLQEFYRFVPKEAPPKKFFDYPGLSFNEEACNDHDILLTNVMLESSGRFRCAVSAEITFQTFESSQDLTVVAIDLTTATEPRLEAEQLSYYPGETGKANCSLGKVSHSLNFTWFINDHEIPKGTSKEVTVVDPEEPSLSLSMSLLQFVVGSSYPYSNPVEAHNSISTTNSSSKTSSPSSFSGGQGSSSNGNGDMRLRCKAELFDLYSELSQEIVIQTTQPRYSLSNQDTLRRSSAAINNGGESLHPTGILGKMLPLWGNVMLYLLLLPLLHSISAAFTASLTA